MDQSTIQKLNQINIDFYNTVATSFDSSRQYYWKGWNQLLPFFDEIEDCRVLDVACGNGRFGLFLHENLLETKLSYTGVDTNSELLEKARDSVRGKIPAVHLLEEDIISKLLTHSQLDFGEEKFHFAGVFGFMHHIPSYELRLKLLKKILQQLHPSGVLFVSFWQFLNTERLAKKASNKREIFEKYSIDPSQVEENDYILDWQRGKSADRYCHLVDEKELDSLLQDLQRNQNIIKEKVFVADGKEGNINLYCVIKKA